MWIFKPKIEKKYEKTLKIALKLSKSPYFFHFLEKKSFLNQTRVLRKSFLNQATYVLKNRLYPQSFLNRDSFLNQAFLNRDSTVLHSVSEHKKRYIRNYTKILENLQNAKVVLLV